MKNKSIVVLILSILVVFAGCGDDISNTSERNTGGIGGSSGPTNGVGDGMGGGGTGGQGSGPTNGVGDGMGGGGTGGQGSGPTSCNISISSYEEFDKIRENLSCNYTLTSDIDFKGRTDFEPIGILRRPFTGVLDGAGHTIRNVKIDKSGTTYSTNMGVIGYAGDSDAGGKKSTIKRLTFEAVLIKSENNYSMGVIGTNNGTISNVYVKSGTIEGTSSVGGLVGNNLGTIENSYSSSTVKGGGGVGGLAGSNSGTIENSYSSSTVTGSSSVGGLAGSNFGTIENSYATGRVSGSSSFVGGLVGQNSRTIENSYATGVVNGSSSFVGGLVGTNSGAVTNGYYDEAGTGQTDTGKGTGLARAPTSQGELSGFDFANVWIFEAGVWPKLKWQRTSL